MWHGCANISLATSDVTPLMFSKRDWNVSISCQAAYKNDCSGIKWLRITINGSLENVNTENGSRFSRGKCQGATAELKISRTEMVDSGRYYCGTWSLGYFHFYGEGTMLLVGKSLVPLSPHLFAV